MYSSTMRNKSMGSTSVPVHGGYKSSKSTSYSGSMSPGAKKGGGKKGGKKGSKKGY